MKKRLFWLKYFHNSLREPLTAEVGLSHGHYDHTGGLKSLLGRNIDLKVYACSDAFNPKYARDPDGTIRYIGSPIAKADVEKQAKIILLNGPMQIMDSIYATGPVPRLTAFENTGGNFFTDADCTTTDMLLDDQSIFWETSKGIVILSGCAHSGIINTLNYVCQITGNKPIYAVIGGMHLLHADSERLQATMQAFKDYDVKIVIPVHCTGINAVEYFKNKIPECLKSMHTGSSILFS